VAFEKREDADETQSGTRAEATGAREDEDPYLLLLFERRVVEVAAGADSSLMEGLLTSSLAGVVNSLSLKSSRVTLASLASEGSTDLLRRPKVSSVSVLEPL